MKGIKELVKKLNDYAYRYYVLDEPVVSDKDYDELYDRLLALEKETGIILPDSPTQRVGGTPLKKFGQHKHIARLYSLDKVKSTEGLSEWRERLKKTVKEDIYFTVEHKFDGLTLNLTYDKGSFVRATTRGDGITGEDVTAQVKTIKSVPLSIEYQGLIEVQGEGIMRLSVFEKYNKTAETPLKNPRNAAAGALRNLDPRVTASRNLDIIFYNADTFSDDIKSQHQARAFLQKNRFKTGEVYLHTADFSEAENFIRDIEKKRGRLDYLIDGAVIKVDDFGVRENLGFTEKFPRWAVAYKFEAEEATATVLDVEWNVGRSGKLTPIARLTPVDIGGATVQNATLNNFDDISRKNISLNSRVFIRRSNDVIPEILGLAEEPANAVKIEKPDICPSCGSHLEERGPNIFCVNIKGCRPKVMAGIVHYCSKDALDIEGVSDKTVESLYDNLGVISPADLYSLTKDALMTLEKFKDKKADNVLAAIEKSKDCRLDRFIFALGINNIGAVAARELAQKYRSFDALQKASLEELSEMKDFGLITAQSVVDYFADEKNLRMIERLFEAGVRPEHGQVSGGKTFFQNKKFVLTGSLSAYTRGQAKTLIEAEGGTVGDSVSKDTDYLIAGVDAGSKLEKATKLGLKILSEEDFVAEISKK